MIRQGIKGFGAQKIHKANNLVNITHGRGTLHNMITSHYNSKFSYTNGMTVHKWIESKSFRYQYNYGLELLSKYSRQLREPIRFAFRR